MSISLMHFSKTSGQGKIVKLSLETCGEGKYGINQQLLEKKNFGGTAWKLLEYESP